MSDPDSPVAPMPPLQPSVDSGKKKKGRPAGSKNKKPASGPLKKAAKAELNTKKLNSLRFNDEEDLALCRAYSNVTGCAVAATQRTASQFWVDVVNKYNTIVLEVNSKATDGTPEKPPLRCRDAEAVKNRWQRHIGKDMTHFVAEYRRSKKVYKSGWNDDNHVEDAMNKYHTKYGAKFTFLHCWKALSDLPKFDPAISDLPVETTPGDGGAVDLTSADSVTYSNIGAVQGTYIERPDGSKTAKRQKRMELSKARLEAERATAFNNISSSIVNAGTTLSDTIRWASDNDTMLEMIKIHQAMGNFSSASDLLKTLGGDVTKSRINHKAAMNKAAMNDRLKLTGGKVGGAILTSDQRNSPESQMTDTDTTAALPPGFVRTESGALIEAAKYDTDSDTSEDNNRNVTLFDDDDNEN